MQRNVGNDSSRPTDSNNGHFAMSLRHVLLTAFMGIALLPSLLQTTLSAQTQPKKVSDPIPAWSIIGPFPNVGGTGVLKKADPEYPPDTTSAFENIWGGVSRWHPYYGMNMLDWINVTDHAPDVPCLFVARTYVYVPTTRKVHIELGLSGAARFFLNDSLLTAFDDDVFARSGSVTVACTLWQGWNKIHVRIGRDVMPLLSFSLRIKDPSGAPLSDAKYSSAPQSITRQIAPFEIIQRRSDDIDTTFQRDPQVIRTLRQAVAADPLGMVRQKQSAWQAFRTSQLDTALQLSRSVLAVAPEDVSMLLLRGLIFRDKGLADSAQSSVRMALEIDPGDISVRKAAFTILGQRNPLDEITNLDIDSIAQAALREPLNDSAAIETILLDMQQAVIFGSTTLQRVNTVVRVNSLNTQGELPLPRRFTDSTAGWQKLSVLSGSGDLKLVDMSDQQASLNGLEPGDVIIYSAERWHRDSTFRRYAHAELGVSPLSPTRRLRLSYIVPLTDSYQFMIHNFGPVPTERETPSGMLFSWEDRNVPAIRPEVLMPPVGDYRPHIELSTFPGWVTVSRHMRDALQRRLQSCDRLREVVDSLLPEGRKWSKETIAETISRWVITQIDQLPSQGLNYAPHRACDVLALRRGTTADKVILASVMMSERGVEAVPTLVTLMSNMSFKEPAVSLPFDHMALVLPADTSADIIDVAFRPVPLGIAPGTIENAFALPVSLRVQDPVRLHKRHMRKRSFSTSTTMSFEAAGFADTYLRIQANDFDSSAMSMMARSFVPTEQIGRGLNGAKDSSWVTMNRKTGPTCHAVRREPVVADSMLDTITVQPPWMSTPSFPAFPLEEVRRVYPLVLPTAHDSVTSEIVVTAPKGYVFDKPLRKAQVKLPSLSYTINSSLKGQTLRMRRTVVVHSSFVEPQDYAKFREAHRQMIQLDSEPLRLIRSSRKGR